MADGKSIKRLFNECLDLAENDRAAHIQNSKYSESVKAKVIELLGFSGDIDEAISNSVLNELKSSLNVDDIQKGQLIEQYKLLKKIGQGGQGEVWLANRDDGEFDHHVAVKFIKVTASEKELQRFQAEREVLASLQHPNIATLLGGGQTNRRLYMIMEWIDGVPMLAYLKKNKASLDENLRCFLQVCQAVSHAHSKGVIHRDIKPSNILITADGVVKLLDFGIAKLVDDDITQTQGDVMLTFAYSTPEQISGEHVTTATDVYALGLLLYEILTDHKAQHNTESPAAFVKEITAETPPKPSEVTATDKSTGFAAKLLQGDLDNLVMKAIRKEPQRRYSNADDLILDVNNYLQNKPLKASGDGRWYRLGKLFKRNPLSSGLVLAVLTFMTLLPILMYKNSLRLEAERDFANQQALIAQKTTEFLTTLFESVSPLGHGGKDISLNDVLEQGERQLAAGVANQPSVEAALSGIMASIHHHLQNTPKAISYYKQAVDNYEKIGDDMSLLAAQGQLALMYFRNDEIQKSEEIFIQADQTAAKLVGSREAIIHLTRKATVATERGEREESANILSAAFSTLTEEHLNDTELMSRFYHVWGEAIKYSDKERALAFAEKSRDLTAKLVGKVHPFYLKRVNSQAVRLMRLDRHDEARIVLDELLKISKTLYSENHPEYAANLSAQGAFLHDRGYFSDAASIYLKILDVYTSFYGGNNFETARMINNLAYVYEDLGQFQKASELYEKSIELRIQLDPENLIRAATAKANLSRVLAKLNKHQDSAQILTEVMPVFKAHNRSNLYNQIIHIANVAGSGNSDESCQSIIALIKSIETDLAKESATGWRRLGAEIWISQLLKTCGFDELAFEWLLSAAEKSKHIYMSDSDGRRQINENITAWREETKKAAN
ncbi:serine/threonine-protein kinase [Marinicella sp. S1101]|uniref:serine/threonine-protein kinase n=1 Tax=Marinicella marina TaxID=2996016 RepID=UPI002260F0B9|nr:serine/threonine-protein kinase [Marinicella marina]MCX7555081.1 serine/threonine-protein kinase [Marinicella marina]MDJ1141389.1 serine/threonine-protein kinase [Marinicella marina]